MKKGILKSVLLLMILAFFTLSLASCNRGYGCPNEFSLDITLPVPSFQLK